MNHISQPSDFLDKGNIVGAVLEAVTELDRVFGNARLGLVLSLAYFSATAYTTDELAGMCDVSQETVRRWLKPLINVNRVRVFREGRSIRYKAQQEWALKTRDNLMKLRAQVDKNLQGSNDNNLGSLVTVRRMLTRITRGAPTAMLALMAVWSGTDDYVRGAAEPVRSEEAAEPGLVNAA